MNEEQAQLAANARNASDYLTDRLVSPEEADTHIERAERFLSEARAYLKPESDAGKS